MNIVKSRAIITGMWYAETPHAPTSEQGTYGVFFYVSSGYDVGSFGIQVAAGIDPSNGTINHLYVRGSWGETWGAWKQLSVS